MSSAGETSPRLGRVMIATIILLVLYIVVMRPGSSPIPVTGAIDTPSTPRPTPITVKISNPGVTTAVAYVVETNEADSLDQNKLALSACSQGRHISVWAPGYYIYTFQCNGNSPFEYPVSLEAINTSDNPSYTWVDADLRTDTTRNCANCHSGQSPGLAEYPEWSKDGHSRALTDSSFLDSVYRDGYQPESRFTNTMGHFREWPKNSLNPNPALPDYGPGYYLDYPNENDNCADCHVPAGLPGMAQGLNLFNLIDSAHGSHINVATEGVTCDVCHKVIDVVLGSDGLPHVDRPGILSMSFVRPNSPAPFFVGSNPFELAPPEGVKKTCSPIFSESKFCAACHYGKFGDVLTYNSYGEWLDSNYSKKELNSKVNNDYRSCQDCHMSYNQQIDGTSPDQRSACSEANVAFHDFNHNMMNYGADPDNSSREIPLLVRGAATMSIDGSRTEAGLVKFKVRVDSTGVGHKFPTNSPLRELILLIR